MILMQKFFYYLFFALFFFTPLVMWPFTSEIFEFNKIVFVYLMTTLITSTWIIKSIQAQKFIFKKTTLDIPLLIFLTSQTISTILSIDPITSVFGYYSRFNGGLLSTICFSLLYWAFVSNLNKMQSNKLINFAIIPSALIVSIYGILEHFGIDKHIWVQDVQSRVFSTLGQPNWLAAFVLALMPIIFSFKFTIYNKFPITNYLISVIFFLTLLFTKSRSGLVGFMIANIIYWSFVLFKNFKHNIKPFLLHNSIFVILALIIGTQFTPSLHSLVIKSSNEPISEARGPALETGGTESGEIRKIVWRGAIDLWKQYPIFGTGVETFAFSYYKVRPIEHNMVSEWDFIYNKAHNEFLNIMATSGTFGIVSYLLLIIASMIQIIKSKGYALLSGLIGLLVSNFFGFSVVPTQLLLFLFPALALSLNDD